jgi:hypothetical protein
LDFNEFKRRYEAKLEKAGYPVENDAAFNDKMADIYVGLMIYSEYQNDVAAEHNRNVKKQKEMASKPQIYVPGGLQ